MYLLENNIEYMFMYKDTGDLISLKWVKGYEWYATNFCVTDTRILMQPSFVHSIEILGAV